LNVLGDGSDGHYGGELEPAKRLRANLIAIKATGHDQHSRPTAPTPFGLSSDDGGRIRIDGVNVMVDDTNHGPLITSVR
jgi:hypothetical protein